MMQGPVRLTLHPVTVNREFSLMVGEAGQAGAPDSILTAVRRCLGPHLAELVDELYAAPRQRPELVGWLSEAEQVDLRGRQVAHLQLLLSDDAFSARMAAASRELGRVLALSGIDLDQHAAVAQAHLEALLRALSRHAPHLDRRAAEVALGERCNQHLSSALLGYRDVDEAQHQVMLQVVDAVSRARTVADLARSLVEALSGLAGIQTCFFARADAQGRIVNEAGAGVTFDAFVDEVMRQGAPLVRTTADYPEGQGAMGRAWRSGLVERCDSYQTDPTVAPWRDLAARYGWRANASVPLSDSRGRTHALLSVHARWPGYFATPSRMAMLRQVKGAVERALGTLEERPTLASGVSGYLERSSHRQLLAEHRVQMLFQPVVTLPAGGLVKLEALARLRGESRLLAPAEFLPAFGDDDLYHLFDLGLRQSFEALMGWQTSGLTTGVSVNLPGTAADDPRYVRLVARLLAQYRLEPSRLTLELLETGAVKRGVLRERRALDEFKDLGVRLAQDDLGSGYSSLLRLRHFAFDDVKIDQSLVRGTELAPGAALHFITPINDIAHSLGLRVVIEGLEDAGLIEAAVQLGVDLGQGYGIARPMPASEVVSWARGHRLDVDPDVPRTPMGAVAAHVAWEHRMVALGRHDSGRPDLESCGLSGYLQRSGRTEVAAVHRDAHVAALADRGGSEQRRIWQRLSDLVLGG